MRRRTVTWGIIGIAAFVLLDILLVVLLASRPERTSATNQPVPLPVIATPSGTPTPTAPPLQLAGRSRLLVPIDDQTAWRTSMAGCGGSAVAQLEHTVD